MWAAIAIGAVLGLTVRLVLQESFGATFGVLLSNVLGAFLLAAFLRVVKGRSSISSYVVNLVSTGFFGTLTTYSTLALQAHTIWWILPVSMALGVGAAFLGWKLVDQFLVTPATVSPYTPINAAPEPPGKPDSSAPVPTPFDELNRGDNS